MAVGVAASTAASMAVVHTGDLKTFLTIIAGASIGSIISDLDSYNSELSQILNKITAIIVAVVLICVVVSFVFQLNIIDKIVQYKNAANILIGVLVFLLISILGSYTKHRTFMHSLPCTGLYYIVLSTFLSQTFTLPFVIAMLSHIILDLFNHIGIAVLCPFSEKRVCFDLCDANGTVNKILFCVSIAITVVVLVLAVR